MTPVVVDISRPLALVLVWSVIGDFDGFEVLSALNQTT